MAKWKFEAIENEAIYQQHCRWKRVNPSRGNFRKTFWPYFIADRQLYIASAIVMSDLGLTGPLQDFCISGDRNVHLV